jgi:PBP1b-binding outer membrane lipoprotein LpoB
MKLIGFAIISTLLFLAGCASTDYDPHVAAVENQLLARNIQTREIEATSYRGLMSAVISTLQDYHFRINNIDPNMGTITAYQMTNNRAGKPLTGHTALTVLIRQRGEKTFSVRINMVIGLKVEETPELYQQFFAALQRKLHYRAAS